MTAYSSHIPYDGVANPVTDVEGNRLVPASVVVPETDPFGGIYRTARNVLDGYVDYFTERNVPLPTDENGRVVAFVSDGTVVYDQELFSVDVIRIRPGAPGIPSISPLVGNWEWSIEMTLQLIRRVPTLDTGGVPSPEEREPFAQILMRDEWLLLEGAIEMTRRAKQGGPQTLVGAPYRSVLVQEIIPYGPSGGMCGAIATLVVQCV